MLVLFGLELCMGTHGPSPDPGIICIGNTEIESTPLPPEVQKQETTTQSLYFCDSQHIMQSHARNEGLVPFCLEMPSDPMLLDQSVICDLLECDACGYPTNPKTNG
jgi:hypothetical protein